MSHRCFRKMRHKNPSREQWRRSRTSVRRTSTGITEQPEIDDAIVGGQEIEKPLVVVRLDAKQRQHRPITSAGICQTKTDQLAKIVPRDVAREKERMYVIPE